MDSKKKKRLEEKGWKVGSVQEFLELTPEEISYIELKLALSENLKKHRQQKRLTRLELAKLMRSNQSLVAEMEAGAPSISLDLLVRSLLALGVTKKDLARMIA
ncbi:MAG: helix-turn-helix domain-containing protein [candidate division KSB1 bacterium]|nr:helix-turn-helix domain-containing protein [candidate division KSB1 bacterium]MDZ7304459.1 helix-turn-helix domain-containing protein [candidate division KSB1 bacterium]MDZ7310952.1 helix-turn-helix domain-containing protein [candidate division KSB1 bacterium]